MTDATPAVMSTTEKADSMVKVAPELNGAKSDRFGWLDKPQTKTTLTWILFATLLLATVLGVVLSIKAYVMPKVLTRFAVVDVNEALNQRRSQYLQMVNKPGITDADREKAFDFIRKSTNDVTLAVAELAASCNCLLLNKSAVYNPQAVLDLTPELSQRMASASQIVAPDSPQRQLANSPLNPAPVSAKP